MNKSIRDASLEEIDDYQEIMSHILNYLSKNWDINAKPKGYDEYLASLSSISYQEPLEFTGLLDTSAGCPAFPSRISIFNIAYSEQEQDRKPFEELAGALVAYGVAIGERRERLNRNNQVLMQMINGFIDGVVEGNDKPDITKIKAEMLKGEINRSFPNLD